MLTATHTHTDDERETGLFLVIALLQSILGVSSTSGTFMSHVVQMFCHDFIINSKSFNLKL